MLGLSPRAVARLESYQPAWPLPKIFRLTKNAKLIDGVFVGETINTPSMLCVADALDGLAWAERIGGLPALIARSRANLAAFEAWVPTRGWAEFLAADPAIRSSTSICVKIAAPWFGALNHDAQADAVKRLAGMLEQEGAALDIAGHRDAPAHLRIWGGATVETSDIEALLPWLDWGMAQLTEALHAQAA
jgi:phosphoserine aminotransferase